MTTQTDNAHIRLTRVPLHLTAHWRIADHWRAGAGVALYRSIRFKADGIGQDIRFRGATGLTVELAYRGIGLRYTALTYTDQFAATYSANALGLTLTAAIPGR